MVMMTVALPVLVSTIADGEKIMMLRAWRGCEGLGWWRSLHEQLLERVMASNNWRGMAIMQREYIQTEVIC
jgi:hypothetical protein